jgi:hypothetical protein
VDEYWNCADDAPGCSPNHASNEQGLEFSLYAAGGAVPQSDAKSTTLHEQPVAEPNASDLIWSYQCTQCNKPSSKQLHGPAEKSLSSS